MTGYIKELTDNMSDNKEDLLNKDKLTVSDIDFLFNNYDEKTLKHIMRYKKIHARNIENNIDKIDWDMISMNPNLKKSIINNYHDKLNWNLVIQYNYNKNSLYKAMYSNKKYIDFKHCIEHYKLNQDFIEGFIDCFKYEDILKYQIHIGYYTIQWLKDRYY
jgi:hypothetical protein